MKVRFLSILSLLLCFLFLCSCTVNINITNDENPLQEESAEESFFAGMANPWSEGTLEEAAAATGFELIVPEGVDAVISWMDGMAQAQWTANGVEINERICAAEEELVPDSEALTAMSGVYFTGMQTESKELTVGGRCPGYMEFSKGSFGAIMWYEEDLGIVYSVSMNPVTDSSELLNEAELLCSVS